MYVYMFQYLFTYRYTSGNISYEAVGSIFFKLIAIHRYVAATQTLGFRGLGLIRFRAYGFCTLSPEPFALGTSKL